MNKSGLLLLYGVLIGVLASGAILLIAMPDPGNAIRLEPAPTATRSPVPTSTQTPPPIQVQIGGQVVSPGVYSVTVNTRLDQLIDAAGGLTDLADVERVNFVTILQDGGYYFIPAEGETIPETASNAPGQSQSGTDPLFDYPLDLNSANQEALESLPGIGPTKASDIIAYRETNGPFQSLDDLVNVPGIGPATLETIREYLILQP
jgi:competence protein ComEA